MPSPPEQLRIDVHATFGDGEPRIDLTTYGDGHDRMITGLNVAEFAAFTNQLDAAITAGIDPGWVLDQWSAVRL